MDGGATRYRRVLATVGLFTLLAGDAWRYSLSWWGWGAIVLVLLVLVVVELVRERVDLRRVPVLLAVFLGVAAASIAWSAYPGESAIGVVALLATTAFAVFLAACLPVAATVDAIALAAKIVLAASLLFELVVAVAIRRPVLPLWVDYSHLDEIPRAFYWSRDVLFDGGRIQGIVGNANLLAFAALLGLLAVAVRFVDRRGSRTANGAWLLVAVLVLALTRSTTVLIAAGIAALVAVAVALARRWGRRGRIAVPVGGLALLGAAAVAAVVFREPLLRLAGRSADLTNRLDIWQTVLDLVAQRPVLGWGWVGYWPPWVAPFDDLVVIRGVHYLQAHNAWLDAALQVGLVGAVVLLALVTLAVARSWRMAVRGADALAAVPVVVLAALVVHSLAESRLLIEIGWTLLVLGAAWTVRGRADTRAPAVEEVRS